MNCPRCGIDLVPGQAFDQEVLPFLINPDGTKSRNCFHAKDEAALVDCMKCPQCGHSEKITSRAYTVEEVRAQFIEHVRHLAEYWATTDLTRPEFKITTPEEDRRFRCDGVVHSLLVTLDGGTMLPAFDLSPAPSPEDAQYCVENGENWYEPGVINNCQLHDLFSAGRKRCNT